MLMPRHVVVFICVLLSAAAASASSGDVVATHTARLDFRSGLQTAHGGHYTSWDEAEVVFKREPKLGPRTLRTHIALNKHAIDLAWDRDAGLLYPDTDGDLDLTNETPVPLRDVEGSTAPLTLRGGNQGLSISATLELLKDANLRLHITSGWVGNIALAGHEWRVVYDHVVSDSADLTAGMLYFLPPDEDLQTLRSYIRRFSYPGTPLYLARGETGGVFEPRIGLAESGSTTALELRMLETTRSLTEVEFDVPGLSRVWFGSNSFCGILDGPANRMKVPLRAEDSHPESTVVRGPTSYSFYLYVDDPSDPAPIYRTYVPAESLAGKPMQVRAGGPLHTDIMTYRVGRELRVMCGTRDAQNHLCVDETATTKPMITIASGGRTLVSTALEYG
jgi:hypothetical protein